MQIMLIILKKCLSRTAHCAQHLDLDLEWQFKVELKNSNLHSLKIIIKCIYTL